MVSPTFDQFIYHLSPLIGQTAKCNKKKLHVPQLDAPENQIPSTPGALGIAFAARTHKTGDTANTLPRSGPDLHNGKQFSDN